MASIIAKDLRLDEISLLKVRLILLMKGTHLTLPILYGVMYTFEYLS